MQHQVETIYGELLIGYDFETIKREEEFHGFHTFYDRTIELTSVEIVIAGKGIDILRQLTPKQKQSIINELQDL